MFMGGTFEKEKNQRYKISMTVSLKFDICHAWRINEEMPWLLVTAPLVVRKLRGR
jgi:hypothetical protein